MLISSSSDMGKYLVELIKGYCGEGTLLTKESYKELFREQLSDNNFGEGQRNAEHPYDGDYNPAIFIGHSALGFVGHSGGDAGVATWMYFDKKKKTGRYIVINCDMGNDERARELEYYAIYDKMSEYFDRLDIEKPVYK
jgi:CubicO group peptidase (beta-lactamase class C family)